MCAENVLIGLLVTPVELVRLSFVTWRKLVHLLKETFSWKVSGSYAINRRVQKRPTSVCLLHSLTWRQEMPELNCRLSRKWVRTSVKLVASRRRIRTPLIELLDV
ncbi:unnamed protein product [Taenia asiatica]|uniref:Secreted protein n=1 Tax=Taenia asiatica TaxID=60517 RepID=A0A0R3W0K3_TAEAS|nr:unnamed protein product [Taenia asiatica]